MNGAINLYSILGTAIFLLIVAIPVQMHFFPTWNTARGWFTIAFGIIPLGLLGAALLAAYPPLMFLILIIAASTAGRRR